MTDSIPKKVLQGLGQVGVETVEKGVKEAGNMVNTIIMGPELVGDIRPMSEEEMVKAKAEDERKKKEESAAIAKAMASQGRDVEAEMKQINEEEKNEEKKKEEEFLEKIRIQREVEAEERENMVEIPGNDKRESAKKQFAPGKRKSQQPDAAQMSQTSEFKGGKID